MQYYDSLFTGRMLDRQSLLKQFISLLARVYYESTRGLQVEKKEFTNDWEKELLWVRLVS